MQRSDWVALIALVIMLIGAVMVSYYMITYKVVECTADPVKFAAEKIFPGENYSFSCTNKICILTVMDNSIDFSKNRN